MQLEPHLNSPELKTMIWLSFMQMIHKFLTRPNLSSILRCRPSSLHRVRPNSRAIWQKRKSLRVLTQYQLKIVQENSLILTKRGRVSLLTPINLPTDFYQLELVALCKVRLPRVTTMAFSMIQTTWVTFRVFQFTAQRSIQICISIKLLHFNLTTQVHLIKTSKPWREQETNTNLTSLNNNSEVKTNKNNFICGLVDRVITLKWWWLARAVVLKITRKAELSIATTLSRCTTSKWHQVTETSTHSKLT